MILGSSVPDGPTISEMHEERREQDSKQQRRLGSELPADKEVLYLMDISSSKVDCRETNEDTDSQYD